MLIYRIHAYTQNRLVEIEIKYRQQLHVGKQIFRSLFKTNTVSIKLLTESTQIIYHLKIRTSWT